MHDLILTANLPRMIEQRGILKTKLYEALGIMSEAIAVELSATGEKYSNLASFLSDGRYHCYALTAPDDTLAKAMAHVDAGFWNALMNQSGIRAFMSAKKQEEWDGLVREAKTPPFERGAIKATFADLYEKRADMLEEGILHLFRRLSWNYKTNTPAQLGRKVIINAVLNSYGSVNFSTSNELDDLVRILSVYDGKPIPEHRNGMYQHIIEALRSGEWVSLDYFTLKVFKKGTGHIVFHDHALPLIDQCNRVIARAYPNALPAGRAA